MFHKDKVNYILFHIKQLFRNSSPVSILSLGYIVIILISAGLLSIPASSAAGIHTPFLDSLFTAVSAITTTGLIVVDTGSHFSLFGQLIIILLIQIGGLGYMLFVVLVFLAFHQKMSIQSSLMLLESVKKPLKVEIVHFVKVIIILTAIIEITGAVLMSFFLHSFHPSAHSIYSGIFHSISAFNTAGFSIYQDSMCSVKNSVPINTVLILVSTLGSLGFFVLYDGGKILSDRLHGLHTKKLSVHSRLVLLCTCSILVCATLLLYATGHSEPGTTLFQELMQSLFQVSSASTTTGFNSIDIGKLNESNLLLIIILMFIGAGSGGTAGGIKMTTFSVVVLSVIAIINNRSSVNVFRRRLSFDIVRNAYAIVVLTLLWIIMASYIMTITEQREFIHLLFEVTSAIGTVGLSTGITTDLSITGKIIIIISMFIGRIGPLSIGISLFKNGDEVSYKYSTTDIFIG